MQEPKLPQIDPLIFWILAYCIQETTNQVPVWKEYLYTLVSIFWKIIFWEWGAWLNVMHTCSLKEYCYCYSVTKLCLTLATHELQHARLPCPSLSPCICSNSCPLSQWCHPTILSSVAPFSSCPQSFPALKEYSQIYFPKLIEVFKLIIALECVHVAFLAVSWALGVNMIINLKGPKFYFIVAFFPHSPEYQFSLCYTFFIVIWRATCILRLLVTFLCMCSKCFSQLVIVLLN